MIGNSGVAPSRKKPANWVVFGSHLAYVVSAEYVVMNDYLPSARAIFEVLHGQDVPTEQAARERTVGVEADAELAQAGEQSI